MDFNDIVAFIKCGLEIIKSEQRKDGSFATLSSCHADFSEAHTYVTTFAASNILRCLNSVVCGMPDRLTDMLDIATVRESIAGFLLAQHGGRWSWNYWSRDASEYRAMPYPDDLDDTFVALSALRECNPALVDGRVLAHAVQALIATEVKPGGPYRTWLASGDHWASMKPDIAVNANINNFLASLDVALPGLDSFLGEAIEGGRVTSPYYPGAIPVAHFLGRSYGGAHGIKLLEIILDERLTNGLWMNDLESAMAISAICSIGFVDSVAESSMRAFMDKVVAGAWAPHPFCTDLVRDGMRQYAGSRALTAAFAIEAAARWAAARRSDVCSIGDQRSGYAWESEGARILGAIKEMAVRDCLGLPAFIKDSVSVQIDSVRDSEIVLVPYRAYAALGSSPFVGHYILERLALANFYGWMAYAIYDRCLDDDMDGTAMLPVANVLLRKTTQLYRELGRNISGFTNWCAALMDGVDEANAVEFAQCRLVRHGDILTRPNPMPVGMMRRAGRKSLAHALPAVGVYLLVGDRAISKARTLISFFLHYLIARQLHDDAHDWEDDLKRGALTGVGAQILDAWRRGDKGNINLAKDMPELRNIFGHDCVPTIMETIVAQTGKARRALAHVPEISHPEALTSILNPLDSAAFGVANNRKIALEFVAAYSTHSH